MLTYRYKLYSSKRNRKINAMLRGLFCLEPRPRTSETLLPSYRQVLLLFEDEASFFPPNRQLPSARRYWSGWMPLTKVHHSRDGCHHSYNFLYTTSRIITATWKDIRWKPVFGVWRTSCGTSPGWPLLTAPSKSVTGS